MLITGFPLVSRCELVGIESLSRRRFNLSAMFVFDVLSGRVNCPQLLSKFRVNEPLRTLRNADYLTLQRHRVNYGLFEPVNNMTRVFNVFAHFFGSSSTRHQFRSAVRSMDLTDAMLNRLGFMISAD